MKETEDDWEEQWKMGEYPDCAAISASWQLMFNDLAKKFSKSPEGFLRETVGAGNVPRIVLAVHKGRELKKLAKRTFRLPLSPTMFGGAADMSEKALIISEGIEDGGIGKIVLRYRIADIKAKDE